MNELMFDDDPTNDLPRECDGFTKQPIQEKNFIKNPKLRNFQKLFFSMQSLNHFY